MLEIVKLKNPFDRTRRDTERVDFIPGQVLTEYIPDGDVEFVLNGNLVEQPGLTYPCDSDQIIILPHVGSSKVKNILGTIAAMWLSAYVGKMVGGKETWALFGAEKATLATYLAAGAVMYVGGRIINAVFPAQKAGLNANRQSSPTYGWNMPTPATGEGGVVGITYGECIPAPQVLERHVETANGQQYLNLLLCGGIGPVDDIYDIKIGSTAIYNFQDIQIETRNGTNDQTPISFFTDTPLDQAVGLELTESGLIQTSDSTKAVSLEVTIEFPGGLYHVKDDGSFENDTVTFSFQYRKTGTSTWSDYAGKQAICNDSGVSDVYCYPDAPVETWTITRMRSTDWFYVTGSVSGKQDQMVWYSDIFDNGKIRFRMNRNKGATIYIVSGTFSVTAAQNTAVRKSYRIYGLEAARYDVRLAITSRHTGSRYGNTCTWSVLTAYNPGQYARPNKVLLGLRILATNQLSGGIPDITWRQVRNSVYVWNPDTGKYETRSARNPIWAAYDIYHQCRYMKNINTGQYEYVVFGVNKERLSSCWDEWVEAAAYADEQVTGLDGTMEHRFEFDAFYDTEQKRYDAAQKAANAGHAVIMPRGNNIGIKCDKPGQMVQIFGEGRTVMSSLNGTFTGAQDRAKIVEVVYSEAGNDFKNTPFLVRDPDWVLDPNMQDNPAQLELFGVKRRSQAYREGVYTLANNKMVTQFIDIGTDIDAMVCEYGDLVGLNHSVSQMGIASGRIVAASVNTIQLDKTTTLSAGLSYQIMIQYAINDTIATKDVVAVAQDTDTDTLTVTEPFTTIPQQYDNYVFGEAGKSVKPFRLVGVEKDGDLTCKLSLAEYVEGVYTGDLNYPIVDYTPPSATLAEVTNLALAEENYRTRDGINVSLLHISWDLERRQRADEFIVYYSFDGNTWKLWENTQDMMETITNVIPLRTYYVKVCVGIGGMQSSGVIESLYITGKDEPPSDVTELSAFVDPTDSTKITLMWTAVDDVDLNGYQVREGNTIFTQTPISDTRYVYTATESRQHNFSVVAIDNSGNPSRNPATKSIAIVIEPAQVAGFTIVPKETDRSRLEMSWQANMETDLSYYEIRQGQDWNSSRIIATQLKATNFELQLTSDGNYNFMIKAVNISGHSSIQAAWQAVNIILRPDAPTNLVAVQEPRDRSMVKITWDASPGKDIVGYELRYGHDWDSGTCINTTADTQYGWYVPASGSYNIMIKAKTVAGYYSNVANVVVDAFIEAYDVTGFTASQNVSDRTKVRLVWDNPLSLDVAYFEIRKGPTWDSGTIIESRATGTFYDVIVTDETEQTFWIKAVTVAGNYSQNAVSTGGIFNLNPNPVSNIQISQDPNDKSIVVITWDGITESDLAGYQVVIGYAWESGIWLPLTSELKTTYKPAETGDVKIMIKSMNAAGYYSDEVSNHQYIILEPLEVTGFQALQNGANVEFYWEKSGENDVAAYEIREGAGFDMGMLVASGITLNSYSIKVDVERNYQYHIKAINRSNHYSRNAASQMVYVSDLPPKNVILEYDEVTRQDGMHSNTEFGLSLINFQTFGGKFNDYPTTKFSDVGGNTVLKLKKSDAGTYPSSGEYDCSRIDVGQVMTANVSNQFVSTVNLQNSGSAKLQMRISRDGINWTAWQDFRPAQYTFRYLDRRVLLATEDVTKTPEVNQLDTMIDVDDTELVGTITVPVGGITVLYPKPFYTVPVVTPTAIGENVFPQITAKTTTGFTVKIVDRSGADVGGQLDWRAKGY